MTPFVLKLRYLTGRSIATSYNDRERPEWPPHPARVYSALVAAWAESEEQDAAERSALEWLASLDPPGIYASEASRRQVVPHFVPVNDISVLGSFDRQRDRLSELKRDLDDAKTEYERAREDGDTKSVDKIAKRLAKAEQALGAERTKLQRLLVEDQKPFANGKHPATALKSANSLLPERRGKQPRTFPSVTPEDPRVFLHWSAPHEEIERHRPALSTLASRVVRVGHSASLVSCTVVDDGPAPTWRPNEDGGQVLRVPGPNQLTLLEEEFERHKEVEPRVLPCRYQRYDRVLEERGRTNAESLFGQDWIVFRQVNGRRLSATSCVEVARAMRGALMRYASDPPPELLSGHAPEGGPSEKAHLAVIPLPFVGSAHASGDLLGVALVFPRETDEGQRLAVLRAIGLWEEQRRAEQDDDLVDVPPLDLVLGRAGVIEIERVEWGHAPLRTLRAATWCRPSHSWVTATPIALDRHPDNLYSKDTSEREAAYEVVERSIATSCERIGLPTPSYVRLHPSVPLRGTVKARAYPPFPVDPKKHQRIKVHARIEFPVRVNGPLLLGAGRYYGLGLCLPLNDDMARSSNARESTK